jgi:serine/threonine protein kinase/tetratricopeptide (TPR) repeat protein
MAEKRICGECGAEIALDAPQGLCLQCLAKVALSFAKPSANPPPNSESAFERIHYFGDYELLEEIARGGMGVVFRARQVSLNRIVAVKMLLFGRFASDEFVKRFRAEAEAAANLQHPNIVAIHEIGEHEGQHYFSMDYVAGENLAQLVRENSLPAKRAAEYVKIVAETIHYAHQHGVLHRDLKPSNILIDQFDRPRITDFGLAKRLDTDPDISKSGRVMGSPSYMPPEQANPQRGKVGIYSDVYSLGAVLYHLVTGRPPFLAGTLEGTILQLLHNEPVPPRMLNGDVPRVLETICLKCLEREPRKRYGSAQELADDLGRWLEGVPIAAHPISSVEKVWRWCRRKPAVASLSAAVLLSLLAGTGVSTWLAMRATRNWHIAIEESAGNDKLVGFMREMLEEIPNSMAQGRDATMLRELVDKASARMDKTVPTHHRAEANLRNTVGKIYLDIGDYAKAETMFQQALTTERELHGSNHLHVAWYLNLLSQTHFKQRRLQDAEAETLQALSSLEKGGRDAVWDLEESRSMLANLRMEQGRAEEAEKLLRQVLDARKQRLGDQDPGAVSALGNLAAILLTEGKLQEAETMQRKVLELRKQKPEEDLVATALNNLAATLWGQANYTEATERLKEALAIRDRVLGPHHPDTIDSMLWLSAMLIGRNLEREAEPILQQLLVTQRGLGRENGEAAAQATDLLAQVMEQRNALTNAEALSRQAVEMSQRIFGQESKELAGSLSTLSSIYKKEARLADAEKAQRQALDIRTRVFGPKHVTTAASLHSLAVILRDERQFLEADEKFEAALAIRRKFLDAGHPSIATSLHEYAGSLLDQGKLEAAEKKYLEALTMRTRIPGPEDPDTIETLYNLANALAQLGEFDKAEERYREVLRLRQKVQGPEDRRVAETVDRLVFVQWEQGRKDVAETTFLAALPIYRKLLNEGDTNAIVVLNRFAWAILDKNGKSREAEDLLQEILATEKRLHGNEDPIVAERLNNFAKWLKEQRRFEEAESIFIEALSLRKRLPDNEGGAVADSLTAFGQFCGDVGKWPEAEKSFEEAVKLETKRLGKQHSTVVHLTFDLITALEKQEKHTQAEPILLDLYDFAQQSPEATPKVTRETIDRLHQFYMSWALAAPGTGKTERAVHWSGILARFDEASRDLEAKSK